MVEFHDKSKNQKFSYYNSFEEFYLETSRDWQTLPDEDKSFLVPRKEFTGSDNLDELQGEIKEFIDPETLSRAVDRIKELFNTINLGGSFDRDKVVATDKPIGIFDFSLAAKGLFRPQEFYCSDLDMVVPDNDVKKLSSNPNVFMYYKDFDGTKTSFEVVQQQKGTNAVKIKNEFKDSLVYAGYSEEEAAIKAREKYPRAKLKYATKTKKVYVVKQSKLLSKNDKGEERFADIFIPIGGDSYQTVKSLMFKALPALLAAYFMQNSGIKTRISGIFYAKTFKGSYEIMEGFLIKDYESFFDFNKIAILTADSRVFRYKIFQRMLTQFFKAGKTNYFEKGKVFSSEAFKEKFFSFKKFYTEYVSSKIQLKNRNKRLVFFVDYKVEPKLNDEWLLANAMDEFFKLMDAVDIEFNSPQVAIPRIKKREVARGNSLFSVRTRLFGSISLTTGYNTNTNSIFPATNKEIDEETKRREDLTIKINNYMKNQ